MFKAKWLEYSLEARRLLLICATAWVVHFGVMLGAGPSELVGDEERFLLHARNLAHGFYTSEEVSEVASGPGYPLLLMPLAAVNAPWWMLRGLNSFLVVATLLLLYRTARILGLGTWTWVVLCLVGFNPILLRYSIVIRVECLAIFLFTGFLWAYLKSFAHSEYRMQWTLLAGGFFFALTMSRTLFGFVAMAALILVPLFCLMERREIHWKRAVAPFALTLILSLPWLHYVKQETGEWEWSSNGMELVYWMTSTGPHQYGSWLGPEELEERSGAGEAHANRVNRIYALPLAEQDEAWAAEALRNFKTDPAAILRNLAANVSRAFLGFPRSFYVERLSTVFYTLCGSFSLFCLGIAIYPWWVGWRSIPLGLKLSALIGLIYLGGTLLLPAEPRYLLPLTPLFWLWIAIAFEKVVRVRLMRPAPDPALAPISPTENRFQDAA